MSVRVWRRSGERLALAVVSRGAGGDQAARDRALALVAAAEVLGPGGDARPTAAGLLELLEVARETPASWDDVRAEWRALCAVALGAHTAPGWSRVVSTLESAGELELARLWGIELGAALP